MTSYEKIEKGRERFYIIGRNLTVTSSTHQPFINSITNDSASRFRSHFKPYYHISPRYKTNYAITSLQLPLFLVRFPQLFDTFSSWTLEYRPACLEEILFHCFMATINWTVVPYPFAVTFYQVLFISSYIYLHWSSQTAVCYYFKHCLIAIRMNIDLSKSILYIYKICNSN